VIDVRKRIESVTFGLVILGLLFWVQPAWADSFLWNDGTFTTFNVPGALPNTTVATGINNSGEIVGSFVDSTGEHGFLYVNGVFTTINVPGSTSTMVNGINDAGQIVGSFSTSSIGPLQQSFLYSNGVFTTINGPHSGASGINSAGQIVGTMGIYNEQAFLYANGHVTPITLPFNNVFSSAAGGINDSGQIVGTYFTTIPGVPSGFLDSNGVFSSIGVPGANGGTYANGINNSGDIVGFFGVITPTGPYGSGETFQGYLDDGGVFTTIAFPGAVNTVANGINGSGEVVGDYLFATTPEPTSLVLLASGLGALGFMTRRRRNGNRTESN